MFGNELREAHPDSKGSFTFPIDEGDQLLLIVADTDKGPVVLDSRTMRIKTVSNESIEIDLKGKHP
jgi:hypothetical protein